MRPAKAARHAARRDAKPSTERRTRASLRPSAPSGPTEPAPRHSTPVEAIKALNGLNPTRLSIGQVLVVSTESSESSN